MRWFLIKLMSVCVSFGSLYSMDGLYIKRTLPIALRWKAGDARRKHFVRSAVAHLHERSKLYEDALREPCNQKCKDYLKSEIQQDLELLEGLAKCDFDSCLPDGVSTRDRLERLERELA